MEDKHFELDIIGTVRSPHSDPALTPRQPFHARGIKGSIIVEGQYSKGLSGLQKFSHICIFFIFHRCSQTSITVRPHGTDEERGVFATRAPCRPNRLGLSVVKLLSVKDNILEIEDLDILDGTPVVDIKPWVPLSDSVQDVESDLPDEICSAERDGSDEACSRPFTDVDQRKVTVSPAGMDDLESVEELWLELMDFHEKIDPFFTPADNAGSNFRKWLTEHFHDEGSQIFLARIEDETVGYIKLEIAKYPPVLKRQRYGYISDAAVKDSFRGMGAGRLLFEAARDWFRSKGITRIELKVLNSNGVAVGFWRRMGFKPIMTTMYRENLGNGNS